MARTVTYHYSKPSGVVRSAAARSFRERHGRESAVPTELPALPDPHLGQPVGERFNIPTGRAGTTCIFMNYYLSFDEDVRSVLNDGNPDDPSAMFRSINGQTDPMKGYNVSHLIRYLNYLMSRHTVKQYFVRRVKPDTTDIAFLTLQTYNKHVGDRFLLFGVSPPTDKAHSLKTKFSKCVRPVTYTAPPQKRMIVDQHAKPNAKSCDAVLKRENHVYTVETGRDSWHTAKLLVNTHCSCVAYYPPDASTTKSLWVHNGLVPVLFDNGKLTVKECTAENLSGCNYNISWMYVVRLWI